jgi:hypothetical protein
MGGREGGVENSLLFGTNLAILPKLRRQWEGWGEY